MKYYKDSPKVSDDIMLDLDITKKGILENPYSIEKITIYFLEKSFKKNKRKLEKKFYNFDLEASYKKHQELGLESEELEQTMEDNARITSIYYDNAKVVMSTVSPLWTQDGKVSKVVNAKNAKHELIKGKFVFVWNPKGMREGTYVVRWEWKDKKGEKNRSAEKVFHISADEEQVLGHNLKFAPRDKYDTLLLKYIPLMYYKKTKKNDVTNKVLEKLNNSVGQGFLEIDDLVSRLPTLLDPDNINEDFLPLLANFFGFILRSDNKGTWRNQIKHALNLYKQKGTLVGLQNALDKAGVRLLKLTNLWQVVSPFTWTDAFVIEEDDSDVVGYLAKLPLDLEPPDFEVSIRSADNKNYHVLSNNIISLKEAYVPEFRMAVIWNGAAQKEPVKLLRGDVIKIKYKYRNITDKARPIETYVQNFLPLADQRDEATFKYPLKNWNVRLIEESDPVFNLLIQERHPLTTPVIFGKIRTTFMYSEKVWNMDTYNGSLFNSDNPCHLDKDFLDGCSGGQSSKFNVHLEMEEITDAKIRDAKSMIVDYSPFHAMLNNMKISAKITDVVLPPEEVVRGEIKKKEKNSDKIQTSEAIYCEVRYKDGRKMQGRVV